MWRPVDISGGGVKSSFYGKERTAKQAGGQTKCVESGTSLGKIARYKGVVKKTI